MLHRGIPGTAERSKNTAPGLAGCIRLHSYYNMEICGMKRTARYINMYREIDALQADRPEKRDHGALEALLALDIESIYRTLEKPEKRRFWRGIIDYITFFGWHDVKVYFL